jgi:capsular polysaccharide transport system permease protein
MHSPARQKAKEYRVAIFNERNLATVRSAIAVVVEVPRKIGLFATSFIACVVIPAVLSFFYLTFIASYQYESEAKFAVRTASESKNPVSSDALAMLSNITGNRATSQDAYIVADYIRSQSIIEHIGGKSVLIAAYSGKDVDWFSRLKAAASIEDMHKYWKRKILVSIDTQSTIVTLRVLAYSPGTAKAIADKILQRSEILVNEISLRSRGDAYARAEAEVQSALQRLAMMRTALLTFRTRSSTIDPASTAASIGETLAALTREKIALEANRSSLLTMLNAESPTVRFIGTQIDALEFQIKALQSRLTGHVKGLETAASQLADFEDLKLQSMFAEKLLELSQSSLERARAEIEKQQLFLVTIVQPPLPEEERYPRPIIGTLMIFVLFLIVWSMITLVVASIRDHIG